MKLCIYKQQSDLIKLNTGDLCMMLIRHFDFKQYWSIKKSICLPRLLFDIKDCGSTFFPNIPEYSSIHSHRCENLKSNRPVVFNLFII
jgi:hypothetical protein